jgi:protein-tyrosine kinase
MSRIYDALKKLEAERAARKDADGNGNGQHAKGQNGHGAAGNGHRNGHGNGNGNGNGNGRGNGKRWNWRWLFANGHGNGRLNGAPAINFQLAPDAEDAFQRFGTNLLGGPAIEAGQAPKLLALTASRHGEGTTTTAALFSSTLVRRRGGRVAVVEANLRSPGFDQVFGIKRNGGFADLVLGQQSLAEVAQATATPGLFAIGCGTTTLAPSTLFDSPGLSHALEQLRGQFDFVIFDTPPVNVYGDSPILCPRLDAAVIVIEADRTRMPEVERTRRTLERVGVRVMGSVLNRRRNYIPAVLEEML